MLARFDAWVRDGTRDRDALRQMLSACYAGMFGLRASGPRHQEFVAWLRTLPRELTDDVRDAPAPSPDTRPRRLGRDWETGHVPADHDSYLYDFAEYVPALAPARFEQLVDPGEDPGEDPAEDAAEDTDNADTDVDGPRTYTLRAWLGGRRYEAPAIDHNDFVDAESILGLLNAMLAAIGHDDRFVFEDADHEGVMLGRIEELPLYDDD
jgi:hypothetical protein